MTTIPDFLGVELDLFLTQGWGWALLVGLYRSLLIAAGAFVLGLVIGTLGSFGKLYGNRFARQSLELYTTIVRSLPELILILVVYFVGTDMLNKTLDLVGYPPVDVNGAAAGIFVLGIVIGAYATEVIRGAILAVPSGQIEAARAFGMSPALVLRRITLPAMLPNAIPGLSNLWLIAMKNTALLAVLGFGELTQVTRQAAGATKSYFTFFLAAACLYLLATLISNLLTRRLEAWSRRGMA
ncbi:ABC transporter permease subunit [Mesorhizobium sp. RP14(2022)]|jgi:polar amino acid transport system permease protein|uniref:ABC transporter permease subunit n=1 Tax=Mesorhizobium liriopis TaxID=2953882 RepID=A0ABT1CBN1_9HYPH|nr:ABC transporter permease subunit [Mesorhizobium liriopis]MCO6052226.1 ABC transporter permease subunit [Mesorhizobium liriopis]